MQLPICQQICYSLTMIKRDIEIRVLKSAETYGAVSITGPRQSGKTTLVKALFPKHEYVNLENPRDLDTVKSDPAGFIKSIKTGVVIDEIQRYPELLSYIQVSIDESYKPGKYIITGSQNLLLLSKINQSLAGRVSIIKLLPFSVNEIKKIHKFKNDIVELMYKGFYPAIYDKKFDPGEYYANYINTYVERDVRSIQNIGDLSSFNKFLQILATRIGQLLNLSEIGTQVGVSHKTIKSWISILEASYIILLLEPHFKNLGKRIVKSPKVYFTDIGLASSLLKLDTEKEISNYYAYGSLFENLVILDIYKNILNHQLTSKLYFFRDKGGNEIDLIVDKGTKIIPIEIKASTTYNSKFLKGITYYNKLLKTTDNKGILVYPGSFLRNIRGVKILNYRDITVKYL